MKVMSLCESPLMVAMIIIIIIIIGVERVFSEHSEPVKRELRPEILDSLLGQLWRIVSL